MSNFENRLYSELPFCPKFVADALFTKGRQDDFVEYFHTNPPTEKVAINYVNSKRVKYHVEYFLTQPRWFAPTEYIVAPDGTLEWFRWRFHGRRCYSIFNYWVLCCENRSSYFTVQKVSEKRLSIKSNYRIPHPSTIDFATKRLTWKINDKRVSVSDYYRHWEQRYINIRGEANFLSSVLGQPIKLF